VVWNGGQTVRTGEHKAGGPISGELAPNCGFARTGKDGLPADWQWQIHTPTAKAATVSDGGNPSLRIEAARNPDKDRDNYPIVVSKDFPLEGGHSYRIEARMKATEPGRKAELMVQSYLANAYFWANNPNEVKPETEWKTFAFSFTVPKPGDKNYHEQMKLFRARIDWPSESGALLVDDVSVREIQMLDEWASWQVRGADVHSVVADPKFARPGTDDPSLAPGSPATSQGFEPIPFGKIGPFADELRASWPIVEAPGAREYPVRVPQD
jgi:hypothetical protein